MNETDLSAAPEQSAPAAAPEAAAPHEAAEETVTVGALRGAIESAGLPADIRGERLGIPEFATLASALQNRL